ncbi:DNA/RNA non-specific endonuclease [Mucilaginibacter sp. ZT4R22]|uniref:DNA/RNA non-specific endonuclease n=1 Tax=Mucilaginibacter pankratovii TaxID=2772110 RepID=A0ABR7WQ15_9SPHI|nr:DNA/RNA non-specific endonuclease [Mucilaginibacter pankratovii]MBD1364430.1 DNA/RNA non-specific endonuclease [Mucilaginibacter pankratovii]
MLILVATTYVCNAQDITKSDLCPNCVVWVNKYYISIADTAKHNPILVYHVITRRQLEMSDSLKANKATKIDRAKYPFKPVKGYPNETKLYSIANKIYKKLNPKNVIAKGHIASADDYSWSKGGMDTSMRYTFNLAMEFQSQNAGTQLGTEYMCRAMARQYDTVKVWAGTWGSQGTVTDGKITANFPAVYWKIAVYNNQVHCYWMPNSDEGAGQANYARFEITLIELGSKLGFNPLEVIMGNVDRAAN